MIICDCILEPTFAAEVNDLRINHEVCRDCPFRKSSADYVFFLRRQAFDHLLAALESSSEENPLSVDKTFLVIIGTLLSILLLICEFVRN